MRIKPYLNSSGARVDGVIIVGAGLAGLFTALKLAPMLVTVIASRPLGDGASSAWAQGGIAAAIGEGDSPEAHAADTIRAGAGIADAGMAHILAREGPERVLELLRFGVPFDRDLEGKLELSREAAHGARRIVRVKGDQAGRAIMAALIAAVRRTPSIQILESQTCFGLAAADNGVHGVHCGTSAANGGAAMHYLSARAVVLATGGIGQLYAVTTNPAEARGDGLALAARAGAVIADAEFVQFHPTALHGGRDPAPLATEALRGEGAVLVNASGERFMLALHPDAELAPRDIVARAVHDAVMSGRGAFLDCRKAIGRRMPDHFPAVYAFCREAGIDPLSQPIPVAPAAHYHMGGLRTDANGRTSIRGLWACGEAACTGVHGANRLASNSLLEAVVFAARIAQDVAGIELNPVDARGRPAPWRKRIFTFSAEVQNAIRQLRQAMTRCVGLVRSAESLMQALHTIEVLDRRYPAAAPLDTMLIAARLVAAAALQRKESRGAHFRTDYPEADPLQAHRSLLTDAQARRLSAKALSQGGRHIAPPAGLLPAYRRA